MTNKNNKLEIVNSCRQSQRALNVEILTKRKDYDFSFRFKPKFDITSNKEWSLREDLPIFEQFLNWVPQSSLHYSCPSWHHKPITSYYSLLRLAGWLAGWLGLAVFAIYSSPILPFTTNFNPWASPPHQILKFDVVSGLVYCFL